MPVYVYRCEGCGAEFEKRQSFSDQPLTECESCHGRLHKVLQPTAIVFKGSGFYSTDHRSPSGIGTNGGSTTAKTDEEPKKNGADASSTSSATTSETKDSSKPASTAAKD